MHRKSSFMLFIKRLIVPLLSLLSNCLTSYFIFIYILIILDCSHLMNGEWYNIIKTHKRTLIFSVVILIIFLISNDISFCYYSRLIRFKFGNEWVHKCKKKITTSLLIVSIFFLAND